MTSPAIEAIDLCCRYGRLWALAGVSFRLEAGRALLVAGRNGAGKSTLLRTLAGAQKPDRGTLRIGGFERREHLDEVRRRTALLGHPIHAYEAIGPLDNLAIAARFLGKPHRRRDLLPLLERVGLSRKADDAVSTLSAGMRKRLCFARLLLQEPSVALLDEPFGQLDPQGFRFVDELVPALKASGVTVVLASHQLERGARLCDEGLVLEGGRVAWAGTSSELPDHVPDGALEGAP
jgi:heme exporter protein A